MSSPTNQNSPTTSTSASTTLTLGAIAKYLAISTLLLFLFYTLFLDTNNYNNYQPSDLLKSLKQKFPIYSSITRNNNNNTITISPTNISHILFGIVGSMNTWRFKKAYTESWWRPNATRGYLFLERPPTEEFLPWSNSSPPFRVNEDITGFKIYPRFVRPTQVRIVRTILETFRQADEGVRWFVMADDDTFLVVDNLVNVLSKFDHTKHFYIGASSECVKSNFDFSFDMAFGGAGYALSYPLVQVLAAKLDSCLERYPYLVVSDFMLYKCLSDLGVALTPNKGFHQIDLHKDISGLLSSHPQTPFLSLHHIDNVDPIFPNKSRPESINHLMKAARTDHSRLLQQTICYHKPTNWSLSVSWGYSAQIYESILPRSFLRLYLETFRPWKNSKPPLFMFNTRWLLPDPCEAPHVFFFDSVENSTDSDNVLVTNYVRASPRGLSACSRGGNHSADHIDRIRVFSPSKLPLEAGGRDCCDVIYPAGMNTTEVRYRPCMNLEVTA